MGQGANDRADGLIGRVPKFPKMVIGRWVSTSRRVVRDQPAFNQKASQENAPHLPHLSPPLTEPTKRCNEPTSRLPPSRLPPGSSLLSQSMTPSPSWATSPLFTNKSAIGHITPVLLWSPPSPPPSKTQSPFPLTSMTSTQTPPLPRDPPPLSVASRMTLIILPSKPSRSLQK